MKVIGITGKSGAGKTTLADFLGERSNVGVIHLDTLFNSIKEEKFQGAIKSRNKDNAPQVLDDKCRFAIHNNRFLFHLSMLAKKVLMRKRIKDELSKFRMQRKDAVIIEGIHLTHMTDKKMFDSIIYVKRPYVIREQALMERDEISKAEIIERDLPYKKKFSSVRLQNFDYVVNNKKGKEELRQEGEKIYDKFVGVQTFEDRYTLKGAVLKRTLDRTRKAIMSKLPKLREDRERSIDELFKQ